MTKLKEITDKLEHRIVYWEESNYKHIPVKLIIPEVKLLIADVEKMRAMLKYIRNKLDYSKGSGATANHTLWEVVEIIDEALKPDSPPQEGKE